MEEMTDKQYFKVTLDAILKRLIKAATAMGDDSRNYNITAYELGYTISAIECIIDEMNEDDENEDDDE